MRAQVRILFALQWPLAAYCYNFPYEGIQLTDADTNNYTAIRFGDSSVSNSGNISQCRTYPGDSNWPSTQEWDALNKTLEGTLIKPIPVAAPCYQPNYDAAACQAIQAKYFTSPLLVESPAEVLTQWTEGNTCPMPFGAANATNATCGLGGYPSYVVNASTVKHMQLAVNFARNANIRLIMKNTGHDFLGKSTGGGSLSIWTHHLKSYEFLPSITIDDYTGPAAKIGAGIQAADLNPLMIANNYTILVPRTTSVGVVGGWLQGGGHSALTSLYGLGADQILSLEVVTADGRFVTADPDNNEDLFYAIRGGGGGVFGVVTSVIVKAYPATSVAISPISFSTADVGLNSSLISNDTFWDGIRVYFQHVSRICDAKGSGLNYLSRGFFDSNVTFTLSLEMPFMNESEASAFSAPLIEDLRNVGINITNPVPNITIYGDAALQEPGGFGGIGSRFATRLFPRENLEDEDLLDQTVAAIRSFVQDGGYTFHGINFSPTEDVAGYPDNSVNPAFRKTTMLADGFASGAPIGPADTQNAQHALFQSYIQKWRDVSPGAGSYLNEADVQEPNWQQAFYGDLYDKLLSIKRRRDPWNLFWAPTGVGSEGWQVRSPDGLPTQNGPLCQTDV